jgi:TatD DNase family protein
MSIIDTHAHLYADEFQGEINTIIHRARHSGVSAIVLPNIDLSSLQPMLQLSSAFPDICFPALGLHPTSVKENYCAELEQLKLAFDKHKFVAVGEIGMDFYWDTTYAEQQADAFRIQIGWAVEKNLPIIIHTRKSFEETFKIVSAFKGKVRGVFHCFSGSKEEAQRIISLGGFLLGIGGVITYKNAKLPEVLKDIPLEHLVLETDSPYLPPVPYRGQRNESSYITYIAQQLAASHNKDVSEIISVTAANARSLFGLPS